MKQNDVSSTDDRWKENEGNMDDYILVCQEGIVDRGENNYIQPIDLSQITSRKIFDRIVSDRIGRKKFRLMVSGVLLDIVVERGVSIPALSVFCLLGQKIGYNNMVMTSMKELVKGSGYVRQTVANALQELKSKQLIREVDNRFEEKDSRLILVNPVYFFLGWYGYRDTLIIDWITAKD